MHWQKYVRQYWPLGICAIGCGVSMAYVYYNTLGLSSLRTLRLGSSRSQPVQVDVEAYLLKQQIDNYFKWRVSLFHMGKDVEFITTDQWLDLWHRGSTRTRFGAIIGLPQLFTSSSLRLARDNPVSFFKNYNIDVDTQQATELLNLFDLSTEARMYALAREMYHAHTLQFHNVSAGIILFFMIAAFILSLLIQLRIPAVSVASFLIIPPGIAVGGLKSYAAYNRYVQADSDRQAASISESVAKGGLEYYSKLLARKQALIDLQQDTNQDQSKLYPSWFKPELSPEERHRCLLEATKELKFD